MRALFSYTAQKHRLTFIISAIYPLDTFVYFQNMLYLNSSLSLQCKDTIAGLSQEHDRGQNLTAKDIEADSGQGGVLRLLQGILGDDAQHILPA
jgi:hypothetical protein